MAAIKSYEEIEFRMDDAIQESEYPDTREHDEIDELEDAFWYENPC